jgi:apolipoprotein N-acyltransferase
VHATDWRLAPVICYEDLLPGYLHRVGALHPNLLVNLTSDSWFGAGSEPWEHLALSVFASVEMRVALVRSVNSGISALVDPNGRLVAKSYADDPYRDPKPADGLLVSAPRMPGGETLFVAWGNWFAYACTAAIVGAALFRFGTRFSRRI